MGSHFHVVFLTQADRSEHERRISGVEAAGYVRDIDVLYKLFIWSLRQLVKSFAHERGLTPHFPSAKPLSHVAVEFNLLHETCHDYAIESCALTRDMKI